LADEAVRNRVLGVVAAVDVLDVQARVAIVEVLHDACEQALELLWIEATEVVLPPDGVLDFGPRDAERVLHRPARARRIGVVDERPLGAELGRKGFLLVEAAARADAAAI